MSRALSLFNGLHGINFNAMDKLVAIFNSDRACFSALTNCFRAGNAEVISADVGRIETLLKAIESRSRIVNVLPMPKPSKLCGSVPRTDTTPVLPPNTDRPITTAPPGVTRSS